MVKAVWILLEFTFVYKRMDTAQKLFIYAIFWPIKVMARLSVDIVIF